MKVSISDHKTGKTVLRDMTPTEEADALANAAKADASVASSREQSNRQQKALEALPDILAYIAEKADAPVAVKDKAAELVAVKVVK